MRNPDERRGDLRAQLAAHRLAESRIAELCARRVASASPTRWRRCSPTPSASSARRSASSPTAASRASTRSRPRDGLLEIRAAVTVAGDSVDVDFAGTAPQHDGNLNCPLAVTRSACFYVVRCLTAPDLPASGGAFEPVTVRAPAGLPRQRPLPAAVAAGNTETSSRITDVVFAAFGQALPVPAQGQGTMNNVVFGNDRFTYYETIGGGQGACPGRGRAVGRARRHVEHAEHPGRGARARLPAPRRALRAARRLGRSRQAPRRRRRRPRAPRPRARAGSRSSRSGGSSRPAARGEAATAAPVATS